VVIRLRREIIDLSQSCRFHARLRRATADAGLVAQRRPARKATSFRNVRI
jgi:hypothetical protein